MFQGKSTCIIFLGALHGLIILHTAKAEIPGCHFLETVNITSSQRLGNGSFMYHGIEVPEYLTGQYDYITTENQRMENWDSHLRGCICQIKPCIWICCRFKDWDASNEKCTDGLMEQLSEINPFLKVTLNNGSVVRRNLLKDFIVMRDRMRWLDNWIEDKYTLFENGRVLFNGKKQINLRGYDCLHPNQFTSGKTESFVAAFHTSFYYEREEISFLPGTKILLWLSQVFLALTIAVYLKVRKLRNLHGKCFICYMITSLMYFFHQLLKNDQMPLQLCALHGDYIIFLFFAKLSWLLAMSHQLWRGFTSVNRAESEYSFKAYSTFAWGTPTTLTGIPFLIDHIWDGDPNKFEWVPGIGWEACALRESLSYYYMVLPMAILVTLNTTLFLLTTINFIRVKLSLRHFSDQDERARNLNSRMQIYKVFLRMIFLMDIQWSFRLLYLINSWEFPLTICRYCDSCIGIIIFIMFVLKRSTLKLLWESIRNRSD